MLRRRSDSFKVTMEKLNSPIEIPQLRNAADQTRKAAVKVERELKNKVVKARQRHRRESWTKLERHPKAMCAAVGAGSPAPAEEEGGEGLSQPTTLEVRGGGAR